MHFDFLVSIPDVHFFAVFDPPDSRPLPVLGPHPLALLGLRSLFGKLFNRLTVLRRNAPPPNALPAPFALFSLLF